MKRIKRNLDEVLYRNKLFYDRNNTDRPLFNINILLSRDYMQTYKETYKCIPMDRELKPEDIVTEALIKDIDNFITLHEEVDADNFFAVQSFVYMPWMEAIVGCQIYAGRDSLYSKPFIESSKDYPEKIDLSENNKWLSKLLEMDNALLDYYGDSYPTCCTTLLRGPTDITSAAIGPVKFCLELYDNPDKLKKLIGIFTDAFIKVAKLESEIASRSKFSGFILSNFGLWTPEPCHWLSDDAIVYLSPKFFREFILKNHLKIDENFESYFCHIHPTTLFMVDELVNYPNLKIVEINREILGGVYCINDLVPAFKKLQDSGKSIMILYDHFDVDIELIEKELIIIKDNLSNRGMCIQIYVEDVTDGIRKVNLLKKIFK